MTDQHLIDGIDPVYGAREYAKPTLEAAKAISAALEADLPGRPSTWDELSLPAKAAMCRRGAAVIARFKQLGFLSDLAHDALKAEGRR